MKYGFNGCKDKEGVIRNLSREDKELLEIINKIMTGVDKFEAKDNKRVKK